MKSIFSPDLAVRNKTCSLCNQQVCNPLRSEQRTTCPLGAQGTALCSEPLHHVIYIFATVQLHRARNWIQQGQLAPAGLAPFIDRNRLDEINAARYLPTA